MSILCVYLRTKFQVSSLILTRPRQGGGGGEFYKTPYPLSTSKPKRTPKEPTQIRFYQMNKKRKTSEKDQNESSTVKKFSSSEQYESKNAFSITLQFLGKIFY